MSLFESLLIPCEGIAAIECAHIPHSTTQYTAIAVFKKKKKAQVYLSGFFRESIKTDPGKFGL